MNALQNKITRLSKMAPQRSATPSKTKRMTDSQCTESGVALFTKE